MANWINATWRDIARKVAPGFLSNTVGEKVVYCLGMMTDLMGEWLLQAAQAHFPLMCDASCLPQHGKDRGIMRGYDEAEDSYRSRLLWWWNWWRGAGHAYPMMDLIAGYMLPATPVIRVVTNSGGYYTRLADGTKSFEQAAPNNWDWDTSPSDWWRFWVIIYDQPEDVFPAEDTWGNGTWGDGYGWGQESALVVFQSIREIVRQWKPAHAACWWIIVSYGTYLANFTTASAETDGDWEYWGVMSGVTMVANRDATARYADGTESIAVTG